jgi:hypothetical protein
MGPASAPSLPQAPAGGDSRSAARLLRPLLVKRLQFVATIDGGPMSGRSDVLTAVALEAIEEWDVRVHRFALVALDPGAANMFRRSVADLIEFGADLTTLFWDSLAGPLAEVAYAHSGEFDRVRWEHRARFLDEFMALIRRAGGHEPGAATDKLMRKRRRELAAGLAFEERARLRGELMAAAHAAALERGERLPALSLVSELGERWQDFRRRARVVDDADILAGRLYPDENVPLVLVDEAHEVGTLGQAALARLFPRAALVVAGEPGLGMLAPGRLAPDLRICLEE